MSYTTFLSANGKCGRAKPRHGPGLPIAAGRVLQNGLDGTDGAEMIGGMGQSPTPPTYPLTAGVDVQNHAMDPADR